jgi:hypothetical protein
MGILSFLPLMGATLVWLPTAVWLLLSGSVTKGVILLAVGLGIMGQVDNVVRPLLLSGSARMNTMVLLVSLMGGVSAFGFIGIVLGPLVAAVVTALVESYTVAPGETPATAPASPETAARGTEPAATLTAPADSPSSAPASPVAVALAPPAPAPTPEDPKKTSGL